MSNYYEQEAVTLWKGSGAIPVQQYFIEKSLRSADRRGWERAREQAAKIAEDNYVGQELGDYKKYKIPLADAIRKMEDV